MFDQKHFFLFFFVAAAASDLVLFDFRVHVDSVEVGSELESHCQLDFEIPSVNHDFQLPFHWMENIAFGPFSAGFSKARKVSGKHRLWIKDSALVLKSNKFGGKSY